MRNKWRNFEILVALIEKILAPEGAVVTSPDRVPDKITGSVREVDASIRYKIGSVSLLLTIECRDRTNLEDSTWIEQLATKQRDIGAAKTIAVSSSGFTQPAIEKAPFHGIEIRRIDEITDQDITRWAHNAVLDVVYVETSNASFNLTISKAETDPDPILDPSIREGFHCDLGGAPLVFESVTNDGRGLNYFLAGLLSDGVLAEGVELNNAPIRKVFQIAFLPGQYYTKTVQGTNAVMELRIRLDVALRTERLSWANIVQYSDTKAGIVQVASASWQSAPGQGFNFIAVLDVRS